MGYDEQARPREATILHADLDSFFASVEQRDDPALRGRPVLVGGGVIVAASYEAKAFGIRTPTNERLAKQLCPHAVVAPPRFEAYTVASKEVFAIFHDLTPLVEGISIDEAFLDVAGVRHISGEPPIIARILRQRVRAEVGLPISVGVARTKFLAKVASAASKPDGLLVVPPDQELEFLHPLAIERLWGVGKVTSAKLRDRGIATVRDLAHADLTLLTDAVGANSARHLHDLAWARDPRRIETGRRRKSIGSQQALGRKTRSIEELETLLSGIIDRVCQRLRKADRLTATVVLRIRYDDFGKATRSHTLSQPTDRTEPIRAAALKLLRDHADMIKQRGITLIGLSLANLDHDQGLQAELPLSADEPDEADAPLDEALDALRQRFGSHAITRAALLRHGHRGSAPMLEQD